MGCSACFPDFFAFSKTIGGRSTSLIYALRNNDANYRHVFVLALPAAFIRLAGGERRAP
jgi:hypothetical protein